MKVSWHDEYWNADDEEHYADFLVVEELEDDNEANAIAETAELDAELAAWLTAANVKAALNYAEIADAGLEAGTHQTAADIEEFLETPANGVNKIVEAFNAASEIDIDAADVFVSVDQTGCTAATNDSNGVYKVTVTITTDDSIFEVTVTDGVITTSGA